MPLWGQVFVVFYRDIGEMKLIILIVVILLGGLQQGTAQVTPVDIDTGASADECAICGMPIRDLRFSSEVFYKDGRILKIDDIGCMFDGVRDVQNDPSIEAIFVRDYYTLNWVDARKAYFVRGGNVFTPMGYNIVALEDIAGARRFTSERGGEIVSSEELTQENLEPGTMMMPGIPNVFFFGSVFLILLVTFGIVEHKGKERRGYPRYDLFSIKIVESVVKRRPFQFILQLPIVILFFLIIFAGLYGTQSPSNNITTILTWVIWWIGLVFMIIFAGKIWCLICPWNAVAEWIQRLSFWKRKNDRDLFTLNKKWPRKLRNIYPAILLFLVLTWLELGYGVTSSPIATAYLGLFILFLAIVSAVIFEGKSFCRYACLVGRISGLYAMFAATELRSRDKRICEEKCETRDCKRGNERGYPCPTFQYPGKMDVNTYCILCTECVKSCKHDNIAFNLRPFAVDLVKSRRTRKDEAYLSLVMLSMTAFHGLTMAPSWFYWTSRLQDMTGLGYYAVFTALMVGTLLIFPTIYYALCWLSKLFSKNKEIPLKTIFINYAYSLLPIALFYHLAHNSMHFLRGSQKIIPVSSDPFGWGWNLFGTAALNPGPLFSLSTIWYIQILLILTGHVYSIYVASKVARKTFKDERQAFRSLLPQLLVLIGFSAVSLWLLAQPMIMRTAL